MADDWREEIIKNKLGGKREWTDQERAELCHKLDKEIDQQFTNLDEKKLEDGWTEENWKEKMAEHPIFSPYVRDESTPEGEAPVNALSEGLAQLKYHPDHNTPHEIARNYKEDGNHHFKYKKYRLAIASFTEGLKQKCSEDELNAQLYSNRAAAQLRLENYRSAIKDCESAVKIMPEYRKAILRAIEAASKLQVWEEVIEWSERGLSNSPDDEQLLKYRSNAMQQKKKQARDERKKILEKKEKLNEESKLLNLIRMRGIKLGKDDLEHSSTLSLSDLESHHPAAHGSCVHINSEGYLTWPVMFLYPEYKETDFIAKFNEDDRFSVHLQTMFGGDEMAPWDVDHKYIVLNLRLFFEDSNDILVEIDPTSSLLKTISNQRYRVTGGTPTFIVLVKNSPFMLEFVKKYGNKVDLL